MSTGTTTASAHKSNSFKKKSSLRRDGSYRIFHITKKQKESDDDADDNFNINKENDIKPKYQKKSFKISNRNELDGWKRKSTKNKRLLFLRRTSSESTTNEIKGPSSSYLLINDLSPSMISNDASSNQLLIKNKQNNILTESSESDALVEPIDETINPDVTLNDLLARADKLETTVQKQEFNKIQPLSRANIHQRRKRFIIACSTLLLVLTVIIAIIIFVVIMTLRYKAHTKQISKTPSIYDV